MEINIRRFIKEGKNIVISLKEVEYLVDDKAVTVIEDGAEKVGLVCLYDQKLYFLDTQDIAQVLENEGVVDYLDKKN